jgi:uncharacterized protein (DUF433 family)
VRFDHQFGRPHLASPVDGTPRRGRQTLLPVLSSTTANRRTICRMRFDRITVDPDLMGGAPTVRGLRIPVATVVSMVADGMTVDEICADLPDLTPDDVAEALRFAAEAVRERRLPLRPSA